MFGVELLGAQEQAFQGQLAGEKFFRQGRALVGRIGLIPDHDNASIKATLTQRDGSLAGSMAGAGNHDGVSHRFNLLGLQAGENGDAAPGTRLYSRAGS